MSPWVGQVVHSKLRGNTIAVAVTKGDADHVNRYANRGQANYPRFIIVVSPSCRALSCLRPAGQGSCYRGEYADIAVVPIAAQRTICCQLFIMEPLPAKVPDNHAATKVEEGSIELIGIPPA
jgi:hypothetical protein